MCIRDRTKKQPEKHGMAGQHRLHVAVAANVQTEQSLDPRAVSYTHLRAHETVLDLVCRLLLEKTNHTQQCLTILTDHTPIYYDQQRTHHQDSDDQATQ